MEFIKKLLELLILLLKLPWEKIVELVKKIRGNTVKNETKTSVEKYIYHSRHRKSFNKIFFGEVNITYTFKDNSGAEYTYGMDIEYNFKGTVRGDECSGMLLYLSMKALNLNNMSIHAFEIIGNKRIEVTPRVSNDHIIGKENGDNGAYWKIPFSGNMKKHGDEVDIVLTISWKNFSPHKLIDPIIIDPKNYAVKNNVDRVNITFKNKSENCAISSISLCEYSRKTYKQTGEYDIYNIRNDDTRKVVLVQHTITREQISPDKIFVFKCQSDNCCGGDTKGCGDTKPLGFSTK